jgi:hypothetical protein
LGLAAMLAKKNLVAAEPARYVGVCASPSTYHAFPALPTT